MGCASLVQVQEEWDEKSDPVSLRLMKEKVEVMRLVRLSRLGFLTLMGLMRD